MGASVITVSGVALPGTALMPVYTPALGGAKGKLVVSMATSSVAGFGAGEYVTVVLTAAPGYNPVQEDFAFSGFAPVTTGGDAATGLSGTISGYTLL